MENLAKSLIGETKVTLIGASAINCDTSNSDIPSFSSNTDISPSFSVIGVPNSSFDAILQPSSSNSKLVPSFSPTIAPPHLSNALSKLRAMKSASVEELVELLYVSESREDAIACLIEKSKCTHEACSKTCQVLAILLWDAFGIANLLLQELLLVYPLLSPVNVTTKESNQVCNVLALFQIMATHPKVKMGLIRAYIPAYMYPFISAVGDEIPIKYMKLSSLGVIGSLVKCDQEPIAQVIVHFLLESEIFPLCLTCMDNEDSLAREVATFIILKILMQDEGLKYCCNFAERFFSTIHVLGRVVNQVAIKKDERWLYYVLRCYVRLSESQSTIVALKHHFPPKLRDDTFTSIFQRNAAIRTLIQQLFCNMTIGLGSTIPKPKEF